jgi:HK97 family phage major capsid protein
MKKEQVKRLRELLAKKAADRSSDEKSELEKLRALADEHGVDIFGAEEDAPQGKSASTEEGDALTEEQVKSLITEGVTEGLKGLGLDPDQLKSLEKALGEKQGVSAEDIEEAVKSVLGGNGIDKDALAKLVEGAAEKAAGKGISKEDVQELFDEHVKQLRRTASKHQFPTQESGPQDFPIEHRMGNLSVGQKQLLNICLNATPGMKAEQLQAIQNADIPAHLIAEAEARGKSHLAKLRNASVYGGKALTTGSATNGAELIPTDLSSDLLNRMYLESEVAAEFISSEIQMPTDSFELPLRTTRPTFKVGTEGTDSTTESSPGTGKVTLSASKLIGRSNFSYEVDEDAIVAILPMITENLASAAADALEDAIINGDTTATHQDSDISSGDAGTLFKGLRKYAIAGSCTTSLSSGGISAANILSLKKNMKRWGVRPRDLMIICGVNGYNDLIGLTETLTADKVGSNAARILTGEAPTLYGVRIVVSSQVREDLNASGVYDGSVTTKGSILLAHRPSWIMGVRRGFTVEIDRNIQSQVNVVVASFRRDFKPMETPSTSLPYTWLGYNYDA